jgi:isocitrate lyase
LATFQRDLAAMGYKYQFITLAGFHTNNLSMFELAHAYRDQGMLAYAELQEREFELERDHGYRAVKHQSFVGAGYFDNITQVISGGQASTTAMVGSTEEEQFKEPTPDFSEAEIHHLGTEGVRRVPRRPELVEKPERV